ncbi:hypothetical protein K461DRAFT_296049 [Myriangium duriaei CBS 260.36]|uniref:RRM domain-containing protein n=1 Tax=Myriangium duriaei CBS 260.36 TaxID=1168546 RepID=A0A9P4J1Q6_9PEZI|nr:hypothetical protein K461DRAFT_296049 [Myriangium duriaei CBS 260.36]
MTQPKPPPIPKEVGDYTILPLLLPATKSFPKEVRHYLYLRPNTPNMPTPTTGREVYVANIPIDTTATHIRGLFKELGGWRVDEVVFPDTIVAGPAAGGGGGAGKKRKRRSTTAAGRQGEVGWPATGERELRGSGESCVVRFVDEETLRGAMRAVGKVKGGLKWEVVGAMGKERYIRLWEGRFPESGVLQESVDRFMGVFNEAEMERSRAEKRRREMPDEDGFVTVVRGGRNNPAREEEVKRKLERQKEKMKGKEDFYRFQTRERRKEEAGKLRRGFEEERRRVQEMRGKRGYRPE